MPENSEVAKIKQWGSSDVVQRSSSSVSKLAGELVCFGKKKQRIWRELTNYSSEAYTTAHKVVPNTVEDNPSRHKNVLKLKVKKMRDAEREATMAERKSEISLLPAEPTLLLKL